ncbi:hypothetical protein VUR80DRAFT_2593 [Thermomyces stellatus]
MSFILRDRRSLHQHRGPEGCIEYHTWPFTREAILGETHTAGPRRRSLICRGTFVTSFSVLRREFCTAFQGLTDYKRGRRWTVKSGSFAWRGCVFALCLFLFLMLLHDHDVSSMALRTARGGSSPREERGQGAYHLVGRAVCDPQQPQVLDLSERGRRRVQTPR